MFQVNPLANPDQCISLGCLMWSRLVYSTTWPMTPDSLP